MRINNTEAKAQNYIKAGNVDLGNTISSIDIPTQIALNTTEEIRLTHLSEYEKRELPVCDKYIIGAIEKANKTLSISGRTFEYRVHEKTKQIMIKVIDIDTKEIIREIPPEKVLDMVAKMMEMSGIIVDERR